MPYYVSVGYLDQAGILKTDNLKRTTATIRLNPSFFDNHLKIDINANGSHENTRFANQGQLAQRVSMAPTQPIYEKGSPFGGYFEWTANGSDSNTK